MTTEAPTAPPTDPALGPPPFRRPNYAPDTYYRFNPQTGAVFTATGQRMLRVSEDFLAGLHHALAKEAGGAAETILYQTGRRWGHADLEAFAARAPDEFGAPYETVHMDVLLETWWWPRTAGGWGTWSFDFRRAPQRLVFLEVRDSAEARALAGAAKPCCHLYAGYFAGGLSFLARRDLECVELQCQAAGGDVCQFLFATPPQVQQARQLRDAGDLADAIVRNLVEQG